MITYKKLMEELSYRSMNVEQLAKVVGNDLTLKAYDELNGKNSIEKAKLLHEFFQLKKSSNEDISYDEIKQFNKKIILNRKHVNNKTKVITVPVDWVIKTAKENLECGFLKATDIDMNLIKNAYRIKIAKYIKDGYSVIFEYNGNKKILIYNN